MKILFVDQSSDLQTKWIEPLRKKGWGVVRARSVEDATRMLSLHGDALEAIVVSEKFVSFGEKQDLPFVVLTSTWNETAIIKHQNSEHGAVSYLAFATGTDELYSLFEAGATQVLKATGTDGVPVHTSAAASKPVSKSGHKLEDYSQVLSRPEVTTTGISLSFDAPNIMLGGNQAKPEVEAIAFTPLEELPIDSFDSTVILDATSIQMESSGLNELPSAEELEGFGEIESLDSLITDDLNQEDEIQFTPPPSSMPTNLSYSQAETPEYSPQSYEQAQPSFAQAQPAYANPVSQFSMSPNPNVSVADSETLRSYLALREQDVAVLSGQVRSSQERISQLEKLLQMEKARSTELTHMNAKQEQQLKHYDQEKQVEHEVLERQVEDVNAQLKERTDKARMIEAKLRLTVDEINKVKERVRVDIRRIRVREKELEGQLEILKKDSSALLQARDEKILDLKRRLDLLEFNMELVQEQFSREKKTADDLKTKLKDAALVMKQAGGLLEQ
jgi:hypothetical protein